MSAIARILSFELNQKEEYIENVISLIDEGNTIPFIARYRKELHGAMDDTTLRTLETRLNYLKNLEQRREEVKKSVDSQGKLTQDLATAIDHAKTISEIEDLYRPYKQKRRTRGTVAREKGLEPLAAAIFAQNGMDIHKQAEQYICVEKEVESVQDAIQGALDIIAEDISDDAEIRKNLRGLFLRNGQLISKAVDVEVDSVYRLYYDFQQSISRILDHQILAMNRGEKEGFLKINILIPGNQGCSLVCRAALKPTMYVCPYVKAAAEDAYNRLILPSIQREIRNTLTERAAEGAIHNFALNLKPLLMQPPVRGFITMGLDPGYAHGCKVAVIDPTGKVLGTNVVYPTFNDHKKREAIKTLSNMIQQYHVQHIAIGNGTASRETESMTIEMLHSFPDVSYAIVNEAGASVYSASALAAEEFPDFDVNLRSAVSIARRLQDPLAELVKIDPKAIGVGQYQHDCPQKELDCALGAVVEDCVNSVGVDVNTASFSLLQQISGLNGTTARNIVAYRDENGPFVSRLQLKKVPKLGPKAFEQCAGFLRVPESSEILDNTGVHPESYKAAKTLIKLLNTSNMNEIPQKLSDYGIEKAAFDCGVGEPTIIDIAKELSKPGRDPRDELPAPILRKDILDIKDLRTGMILTGTVRNVIDFGAFVDIGVHQDGLVHISEVAKHHIRHPSEILHVGDIVKVIVLSIDEKKHRISLSIKQVPS